jgi:probable HAF family extracellular repeat protein
MKYGRLISAMALLVALAIPVSLAAQEHPTKHRKYKFIDIGTFGGPSSELSVPYNSSPAFDQRGIGVGVSDTPTPTNKYSNPYGCYAPYGSPNINHAFESLNGLTTDLRALPPSDTNCSGAFSINRSGEIVGLSENGTVDPVSNFNEISAVLWKNGEIIDLGTAGGNHSQANGINNRGQIVGWALNTVSDPYSIFDWQILGLSNGTQTRAVLWQNGEMQDLGTLGGPDAWANFINSRGQVAGFSYTNSTPNPVTGVPTTHPFLWDKDGGMIDLGTLGGTLAGSVLNNMLGGINRHGEVVGESNLAGDLSFHPFLWREGHMEDLGTLGGNTGTAMAINDAGEVFGFADLPGSGTQVHHATIWRNGTITDLGTLDGDCYSEAWAVNSSGQIVGSSGSCDQTTFRAVLWGDGGLIDLNRFVPPGSNLQPDLAFAINDHGEIGGEALLPDGHLHAFLLIPCDDNHRDGGGCEEGAVGATATAHGSSTLVTQNPRTMAEGSSSTDDTTGAVRGRFGRRYPYRGFGAYQPK